MRRVFFFVFVLLLICEGIAFSSILYPLDLTTWTPYAENGSKVLSITPNEAIFKILRTVPGPKNTLSTDGYAYLISGPINIGDDWGKVVIEGTWWREEGKENYQEMNLFIFPKEPTYHPHIPPHIPEAEKPTNFISISYVTWHHNISFRDVGDDYSKREGGTLPRTIPTSPRRFRFVLEGMLPRSEVAWSFWEQRDDGTWEKLYDQEYSQVFDGLTYPFTKLYLKIGGFTTWEHPVESILHFRGLSVKVYTQEEILNMPEETPTPVSTSTQGPTPTPSCQSVSSQTILSLLPDADGHRIPFPKVLHPGGSSYRGACGSGKPSTATDVSDIAIKVVYPRGGNCYYLVHYKNVVMAGTHLGCRFHDACFDICKEEKGENYAGSDFTGPCHDTCSGIVGFVYGANIGTQWALGYGPYDDEILFWGKREVLGPFDRRTTSISKLKENGTIPQNTTVFSLPSRPLKSLYMIEVKTGDRLFAGTDADIYIKLVDSDGRTSGEIKFPHAPITRDSLYDAITSNTLSMFSGEGFRNSGFERGNDEKYYFLWGDYVSDIDKIYLRRNNSGTGPDWYCEWIKVYRQKWDTFDIPEFLGEVSVHSWIKTGWKKFSAR